MARVVALLFLHWHMALAAVMLVSLRHHWWESLDLALLHHVEELHHLLESWTIKAVHALWWTMWVLSVEV